MSRISEHPNRLRTKQLSARLLAYFAPYKWRIILSLVCMVVVAASTAATAWLIQPALDDVFISKNTVALALVPLAYIGVTLAKGLGRYGQNINLNYAAQNVMRVLRSQVFDKLLRMPMRFFDKSDIGTLMSHINYDVGMMQNSMPVLLDITRHFLTIIGLLGVIFYQNPKLALYSMIVLPLALYPVSYFSRKLRKYGRRSAELSAGMSSLLQEMLAGIRLVKAFATEKLTSSIFAEENKKLQDIFLHQNKVSQISSPLMELIIAIGMGVVIWVGGQQVFSGEMSTGSFFSFVAALVLLYEPFKALNSAMLQIQNTLAGAERVFNLLDLPAIKEEQGGGLNYDGDFQDLILDQVSLTYDGDDRQALQNISLTIRKGERVALVGPSGAGKTSLVHLIPRFYEPDSGRILLNGRDLNEYDLTSLRRNMAFVSQNTFLFHYSMARNIAYGLDDYDLDEVRAAARMAYADDFIMAMPLGYDTEAGEGGNRLSGGQKQRVTIARAIMKNASLLILDEATSALDSESEQAVQQALENLMRSGTSIVIAHRLSTVINADRIVVMDQGRIVDLGNHAELKERCALYRKLCELQLV